MSTPKQHITGTFESAKRKIKAKLKKILTPFGTYESGLINRNTKKLLRELEEK